jgi:release factor glutamine methyltransferase
LSALVEGVPTARARLRAAAETLQRAGIATARVDAEWLLAGVLDVGRFAGGLDGDRALSPEAAARFEAAVLRRARREPLQRILGWEAFRGLRISLTDDVLVPRPETEMLVQWALELLPPPRAGARPLAVDLGTGSGCIACALAAEREDVTVVAVDLSPAAARVARDNAAALGLGARVHVVAGDLLAPLGAGRAAMIVSNPPYLPSVLPEGVEPEVSRWEPRLALDGGADGLATMRRIAVTARARLGGAGALVLETAGESQVAAVAALLGAAGLRDVAIRADLAGVRRFVVGRA